MLKNIAINYFKTFSNKDIINLKTFFSEDIELRDWEIKVKGLSNVVKANKKIFDSIEFIKIEPINLYEFKATLIAEIEIHINNKEIILVTDIFEFNSVHKIKALRAYKGN